jgi:membrane protein YqaA with SNARE-associated domain
MLELISLFLSSIIGAVFWVVSTEGLATTFGAVGWHPLTVGLVCSLGQNVTYVMIYLGGERLIERWEWLQTRIDRVRKRLGERLERSYLALTVIGGLTGLPPIVAMVALAPSMQVRLRTVLTITLPARFLRFTTLAYAGEKILAMWTSL